MRNTSQTFEIDFPTMLVQKLYSPNAWKDRNQKEYNKKKYIPLHTKVKENVIKNNWECLKYKQRKKS